MSAGREKLDRYRLERLAALAAAFAGTPAGDAVVAAVDDLLADRRASRRPASAGRVATAREAIAPTLPADEPATGGEGVTAEPLVVVLAADDELAQRERVAVHEIAERHLLHNPDEVPAWREVATELRGPTIRTSLSFRHGLLATLEQQLDHVAAGHGIVIVPRSRAESAARTDVALVIVEFGAAP